MIVVEAQCFQLRHLTRRLDRSVLCFRHVEVHCGTSHPTQHSPQVTRTLQLTKNQNPLITAHNNNTKSADLAQLSSWHWLFASWAELAPESQTNEGWKHGWSFVSFARLGVCRWNAGADAQEESQILSQKRARNRTQSAAMEGNGEGYRRGEHSAVLLSISLTKARKMEIEKIEDY